MPDAPRTFAVENFGCRAARADGESVALQLRARGLAEQAVDRADLVLVNTCTVTSEADRDARAFIRRIRRRNPAAQIVATGCYAQRAPEELAALPGVVAVVGNSHKALLAGIAAEMVTPADSSADRATDPAAFVSVARLMSGEDENAQGRAHLGAPIWADDAFAHSAIESSGLAHWSLAHAQTRPNLKIQEGCDNRCSFCVIPYTRGGSRSMTAERVIEEVREFVAAGGRELVLSGINLGRWGRDLDDSGARRFGLAGLVARVLDETALERLRLSSIEPMDWTPELVAHFAANRRVAPHVHLPLQSGSDGVLRRMHRRYRPWHYKAKVEALVAACGDRLALGADVMVGFPGETDAEFEETLGFVASLPFTYVHRFPFSPRPGTQGFALHAAHPVAPQVVGERMARLRQLAEAKSAAFRERMMGRVLPALTLHTPPALRAAGRTLALTENFLEYEMDGVLDSNLPITLAPVSARAATLIESRGTPAG